MGARARAKAGGFSPAWETGEVMGSDKHKTRGYALVSVKLELEWFRTNDTRRAIRSLAFKASASTSILIQSLTAGPVSMSHMYFLTQSRNSFSGAPRSTGSNLCGRVPFRLGALHVGPLQGSLSLIHP